MIYFRMIDPVQFAAILEERGIAFHRSANNSIVVDSSDAAAALQAYTTRSISH